MRVGSHFVHCVACSCEGRRYCCRRLRCLLSAGSGSRAINRLAPAPPQSRTLSARRPVTKGLKVGTGLTDTSGDGAGGVSRRQRVSPWRPPPGDDLQSDNPVPPADTCRRCPAAAMSATVAGANGEAMTDLTSLNRGKARWPVSMRRVACAALLLMSIQAVPAADDPYFAASGPGGV